MILSSSIGGETMAAMEVPWFAVINLGNSIIGVSILAMPWCFRECGVILATLLIIFGGFMTKVSCNLLLRASKATRRGSYEFLAYHTLGASGKLAVEMSIIGLLMCTCIAFFVIMGDLGPAIVSKWAGFQNNWELRVCLLVFMAAVIVMPLGLRRSVESLGNISTVSIVFYMLFSSDIILNSLPVFTSSVWLDDLVLWRSAGTLKGLSIFALAFSCQSVLFVVYDSLPEKTPKQMESVVNRAVTMVGSVYIVVGFFGYVAFKQSGIKGDILMSFAPGLVSEVLRLGFTISVALSFPLIIYPCRASIYTLFFSQGHSLENPHGGGGEYIPAGMFKLITAILVAFTLVLGITIPNVEVILGLTGATLGCLICFVFPAVIYLRATGVPNKGTSKVVLALGILILICCTYDNLQSMQKEADLDIPRLDVEEEVQRLEQAANELAPNKADPAKKILDENEDLLKHIDDTKIEPKLMIDKEEPDEKEKKKEVDKGGKVDGMEDEKQIEQPKEAQVANEKRQEPPIPHAPDDNARPALDISEEDNADVAKEKVEDKKVEDEGAMDVNEDKGKQEDIDQGVKKDKQRKEDEQEKEEVDAAEQNEEKDLPKKEDDKGGVEKIVEDKVIEQEHKQEEQDKQLKEIKEKQELQEQIIKQQAEELERLRIQHEEEQKEKEKEKIEKLKEDREKHLKEKEEAARKAKQDALFKQQEELQKQQHELQQQQLQQQQQQQQLPVGGLPVQGGIQQGIGGLPVAGVPQEGLQQPVGGLIDTGLQQQQQQQQLQQQGLGDGMAGVLQQGGGKLGDGVIVPQQQQQVPLQQQAGQPLMQQEPLVQQPGVRVQPGLQQGDNQQPGIGVQHGLQQGGVQQAGVGGQPALQQGGVQQAGVGGQPALQQGGVQQPGVGGQIPLQDGGANFQQGLQGVGDQQGIIQQAMDRLPQAHQPHERVQRSIQDAKLGVGVQHQQQLNNKEQNLAPVQLNVQQQGQLLPVVNKDVDLQAQQKVVVQDQQHHQLDQLPALGQNNLPKKLGENLKPIQLGIDSNAANRQLQVASDSHTAEDKLVRKETADEKEPKQEEKEEPKQNGEPADDVNMQDSKKDINVQHQVLIEENEDLDMELAKSLEQQLNNQFKQVAAVAKEKMTDSKEKMTDSKEKMTDSKENVKTITRKEEV